MTRIGHQKDAWVPSMVCLGSRISAGVSCQSEDRKGMDLEDRDAPAFMSIKCMVQSSADGSPSAACMRTRWNARHNQPLRASPTVSGFGLLDDKIKLT